MDLMVSIEAFCRVAETGSLGGASRRIGVAKSVVATRVRQLEKHLAVALFHRSARAMKLSELGSKYYVQCQDLLLRAEELSAHTQEDNTALSGTLFIQVLPGFALGHFSAALADFGKENPEISFEVTVSDRLVDPVHEGLDVVLQIYPPVSDSLVERKLFPHRGAFCASPQYLAVAPPLNEPADLALHQFARYSYYPWSDRWPFWRDGVCTEVKLSPILKTNSVHLLLEYARAGACVAYLPTMITANDLAQGRLVRVLEAYSPPQLWLSAVYPVSHRSTRKVKAFVEFLAQRFSRQPQWDALIAPDAEATGPDVLTAAAQTSPTINRG